MILYFSVFLLLIVFRSCGKVTGLYGSGVPGVGDQMFVAATEAMHLVPMLCLLLVTARIRAMHIDPAQGHPQPWAQVCMYVTTWAFLTGFLLALLEPCVDTPDRLDGVGKKCSFWCVFLLRVVASVVIYGGCASILASIFVHRSPSEPTPLMHAMTQCVLTLIITYLAIHLVLTVLQFMRRFHDGFHHREAPPRLQEYGDGNFDSVLAQRERESFRQHGAERIAEAAIVTLHFAPMLCVLLIAI